MEYSQKEMPIPDLFRDGHDRHSRDDYRALFDAVTGEVEAEAVFLDE